MNAFVMVIVTAFILSLLPTLVMAEETSITINTAYQTAPAIYGDRIVWTDYRNGYWDSDIYMYDIANGEETQITTTTGNQTSPAIYGSRIVWEDDRNANHDIYMYDLGSMGIREFRITTDTADQMAPQIYGDRIVWEDHRNGNFDIYLGDLAAHKEIQITDDSSDQVQPVIWGDRIVWTDYRNDWGKPANTDIYMYNIATGIETRVTTSTATQINPAIYGDTIVWEDNRDEDCAWDIYVYDIVTGWEYPIQLPRSERPYNQREPAIYEDRIVYEDDSTIETDIIMYNISSWGQLSVTADPHNKGHPAIYENRIVWEDTRNGNSDIYMYTIPQPPTADFAVNLTTGTTPLAVQFTDLSTGNPTSWFWNFGDGGTSLSQNPSYTYYEPGTYTVTLTVSNAMGSDSEAKLNYITTAVVAADFSADIISGMAPLTVQFTDLSTGNPTSWFWNFGDGGTSLSQNPSYTYYEPGTYTVTLTVSNAIGSDTETKVNYVTPVIPEFSSIILVLFLATAAALAVRFYRNPKPRMHEK